jgi:predicted permease
MPRWIDVLRRRVTALVRGRDLDRDLDRELRAHINQQIDEGLAAGLAPDEARLAAVRAFGPVSAIEEACRDTRRVTPVHNIIRDVRYAGRTLLRHPVLLCMAASSIGLGVGANLTIFSLANELLLSPPTAFEAERLVYVRTGNGSHVSYPGWRGLNDSGALAGIAGYSVEEGVNWRGTDVSVTIMPLVVTANFFDVVGVPMALGRGFTAREAAAARDPRLVVLSDRFWRRQLGGDPSVVGRPLAFNGDSYTVIGVLAAGVRSLPGYGLAPDVYLPISRRLAPKLDDARTPAVQLIGRLHDGQGVDAGRAALSTVVQRIATSSGDQEFRTITVFSPVGGVSQVKEFQAVGAFFLVLLVVTGLVLAIACANVAGLLLARGTTRRRELALRVALGASRSRLVQQLLTEGFVLALAGTLAGLALTAAVAFVMPRLSLPLPIPLDVRLAFDHRLVGVAFGLVLLSTMLCSLMPALNATRPAVVSALKQEEPRYVHRRLTLRGLLVTGQVAVTALLLVVTVVFLRNLTMTRSLDPGFDTEQIVVAQLTFVEGRQGPLDAPTVERIVERVRALPGVASAAFAEGVPLTLFSGSRVGTAILLDGADAPVHVEYDANRVGPGYFAAMGIPRLRGRDFQASDRAGAPPVAIVNQAFAERYFPGRDPLGLRLQWEERAGSPSAEIVGVVANSKYRTLGEGRDAAVYTPYLQQRDVERMVHVLAGTAVPPGALAAAVRDVILQTDDSVAVTVQPMSSALGFAFLPSRIGAVLFGIMGLLGTLLAMVGLYGVMSFGVARRTTEIGIRMALGASSRAVLAMVLKETAVLVGAGLAMGLGLATLLAQPLAAFVVADLSPGDPLHFAGTALLIVLVSLAASWSPARRAIRIEPAAALRSD